MKFTTVLLLALILSVGCVKKKAAEYPRTFPAPDGCNTCIQEYPMGAVQCTLVGCVNKEAIELSPPATEKETK